MALAETDNSVEEQPDGSAIVQLPEDDEVEQEAGFYDNLAETLDTFTANKLASDLLDLIEKDQKAREKRDKQYAEGLRRTGLGDDAPGGANFDGASDIVHPVLAEGCVDFAARAIKELCPAAGPVKTQILGESNEQRLEKAKKKRDYLNWLLTKKMREYRAEKEILLTQLPLGGSQYEKYWFDPVAQRIKMEFVPIDKVLLPYSAASFYTTPRLTHLQDVTQVEFEDRIDSGFYFYDRDLVSDQLPEQTSAEAANDKIEGLDEDAYNEDGLRRVFEVTCDWDLGDGMLPYVVHIDDSSMKVIGVYRNWDEQDETETKLDWWVEDKFIPWRGIYGIGLPHLIGGMAGSLTGTLRALLDSAHIQNSPGAVKLKGSRQSGANTTVEPTEIKEIDAPPGVDDIRKVMMPLPFNGPSPVLLQLLDWITNAAKGVVATAEERIADAGNNMPVGTTLALIEQGSQVFSSIHARLHAAQAEALKIVCRLIVRHPDAHAAELQKFGLQPQDFSDMDGIEPVSDPNIFSEAQRFAQLQSALQLATQLTQMGVHVNMQVLGRRGFELLRMDGVDEFLPAPQKPLTSDPISENVAASKGTPLKPDPNQDHLAHAYAHVGFVLNPIHQLSQGPDPSLMAILNHVGEHMLQYYQVTSQAMMQQEAIRAQSQGEQLGQDQLAMRAAQAAQQLNGQLLGTIGQMMQQAGQIAQQKMPPPQMDPATQATFNAAMADIKSRENVAMAQLKQKDDEAKAKFNLDQQQQSHDQQIGAFTAQGQSQLDAMRESNARAIEEMRGHIEMAKNQNDNYQHQITELLKNRDDNQTAILLEQLKQEMATHMPAQQPSTQPENDAQLKQLQQMLGELEKSRTSDALATVTEGLRSMIQGQQQHQLHMTQLAGQILNQPE